MEKDEVKQFYNFGTNLKMILESIFETEFLQISCKVLDGDGRWSKKYKDFKPNFHIASLNWLLLMETKHKSSFTIVYTLYARHFNPYIIKILRFKTLRNLNQALI